VGALGGAVAVALGLVLLGLWTDDFRPRPEALALVAGGFVAGALALNLGWLRISPLAPSTCYIGALASFHLGLILPWATGWIEPPRWLDALPDALLARALLCVLLGFVALELGVVFAHGRQTMSSAPTPGRSRPHASALHPGGLMVAAMAAAAAGWNVYAIGLDRFLSTSYGFELYAANDARLMQTALFWLLPAGLLIAFAGARAGAERRGVLALSAVATLLLLWLGNRGYAISFVAALLVLWNRARGGFSVRAGALTCGMLLTLTPAIAVLRQLPRNEVTPASILDAAASASPLAALTEMGGSLRPLCETLRLVPAEVPYRLGRSYVSAARRVVPNVGFTKAENEWTDPADLPPNHWITYAVDPWTYANFGGLGFSAVAEPYLNFGVAGILAYFLALGAVLGRLDALLVRCASRRILALVAVCLMPLLFTVRNDFHNFVRPALWGMAVVLLIEKVHGRRRLPRRAHVPVPA
jgi:hypothetical protein